MATIAERIAEIDAILEAGATQVSYAGTTTVYDFDQLRAERRRLQQENTETTPNSRPVASNIFLGGF